MSKLVNWYIKIVIEYLHQDMKKKYDPEFYTYNMHALL